MSYSFLWEGEAIATLLLTLLGGIPSGLIGIVTYVLTSMALYTIAQRRQIRKSWLAWVPVLNCWILGSLSDQYRYVVKGQYKSKRKWLIGLNILKMTLGACMLAVAVYLCGILLTDMGYSPEFFELHPMFKPLLGILALSLPLAGITIAAAVIRFMALFDVYTSVDPTNAVLFLVLSILIPVVEPFFLFFNREKDTGMPPRRQVTLEPEDKDYL